VQVHPGGHAHEGVVDRERVLSIAQRPCSPSPCRVARCDDRPVPLARRVQSTCQSHGVCVLCAAYTINVCLDGALTHV